MENLIALRTEGNRVCEYLFITVSVSEVIFTAKHISDSNEVIHESVYSTPFFKYSKMASVLTVLKRSCKEGTWKNLHLTSLKLAHYISRCFTIKQLHCRHSEGGNTWEMSRMVQYFQSQSVCLSASPAPVLSGPLMSGVPVHRPPLTGETAGISLGTSQRSLTSELSSTWMKNPTGASYGAASFKITGLIHRLQQSTMRNNSLTLTPQTTASDLTCAVTLIRTSREENSPVGNWKKV